MVMGVTDDVMPLRRENIYLVLSLFLPSPELPIE